MILQLSPSLIHRTCSSRLLSVSEQTPLGFPPACWMGPSHGASSEAGQGRGREGECGRHAVQNDLASVCPRSPRFVQQHKSCPQSEAWLAQCWSQRTQARIQEPRDTGCHERDKENCFQLLWGKNYSSDPGRAYNLPSPHSLSFIPFSWSFLFMGV